MPLSLNHASIRTTDIEATRQFCVDVLGLEVGPRPEFPFPGHWLYQGALTNYANAAVHVIGIDPADTSGTSGLQQYLGERSEDSLHGSGAVDHVAFFATGLPGMLAKLQARGMAIRESTVPGVGLHPLFLDDPSGIVLELNYPLAEKQAWDSQQAQDQGA